MTRLLFGLGAFAAAALLVVSTAVSQQPPEKKGPPGGKKGPPYELGRILPPFAREQLDLTPEQQKQLAELEAMVKERLEKILTAEQKAALEDLRPPFGPGGKGGPPGKGKGKGKGKGGPPDKNDPDGPVWH
jgi:Spy/CpxP family protein refolding chaperone